MGKHDKVAVSKLREVLDVLALQLPAGFCAKAEPSGICVYYQHGSWTDLVCAIGPEELTEWNWNTLKTWILAQVDAKQVRMTGT